MKLLFLIENRYPFLEDRVLNVEKRQRKRLFLLLT